MRAPQDLEGSALVPEQPLCLEKSMPERRPWGYKWRSSVWFITLVVGTAMATDLLAHSMIIPIIPFRLQSLGYSEVSSLAGWLLFAYSGSVVIFTPIVAYLSELYMNRKIPLLVGQVALIGSQALLMEAPAFWVMVIARIIQGFSASVITVAGLALICDTAPENIVGKQLGLAMMGMSFGFLVGPPVSGALDQRFGFRGPFVFSMIITAVELIGRLLIIERGVTIPIPNASSTTLVAQDGTVVSYERVHGANSDDEMSRPDFSNLPTGINHAVNVAGTPSTTSFDEKNIRKPARLTLVGLLFKLAKSTRALSAVFLTFSYALMISTLEPVIPVFMQSLFHLDASKIGLVYIAAVVPSFVSAPLSGWFADWRDTTASVLVCLLGSLPFWGAITVHVNLVYFVVMFAFLSFFGTATISPITAEFAAVTRTLDGVGYGHVYGAFNVAYAVGGAVGPVIGGQLFDHVEPTKGWLAVCLFNIAFIVLNVIVTTFWFGETTGWQNLMLWLRRNRLTGSDPTTRLRV